VENLYKDISGSRQGKERSILSQVLVEIFLKKSIPGIYLNEKRYKNN